LVSSSILPARHPRASEKPLSRSRITTCGRLLEGTDEICLGQTWPYRLSHGPNRASPDNNCHTSNQHCPDCEEPVGNVAEQLALRAKTVSFSQCRFEGERRRNQSGDETGREPADQRWTVTSSDTASTPVDNATITADYYPQSVDNSVDSLLWSPPGTSRGSRIGGGRR
jgi:hypothetical protein